MKTVLIPIPNKVFLMLSKHALAKNTTAEKLAARFLCGAYCHDEYDDIDPDDLAQIEHAWLHADPDVLDTDEGVRAYYDAELMKDDD